METVTLLLNAVPTAPLKEFGVVNNDVAPETASTEPSTAPAPMPQRRMMAKAEAVAGWVTSVRARGSTCNNAARTTAGLRR